MSKATYDQILGEMESLSTQDLAVVWATFTGAIPGLTLTAEQTAMVDSANAMDAAWRARMAKQSSGLLKLKVLRGYGT